MQGKKEIHVKKNDSFSVMIQKMLTKIKTLFMQSIFFQSETYLLMCVKLSTTVVFVKDHDYCIISAINCITYHVQTFLCITLLILASIYRPKIPLVSTNC